MTQPIEVIHRKPSVVRISARTAFIMLAFTIAFTALMAASYRATLAPIEASAQKEKLALIGEVLPSALYNNNLLADWVEIPPTKELGLTKPSRAYRARLDGKAVALVIEAAAPDGYSGRIGLLLAFKTSGELLAMRVTEHRETPGLGDYIEPKKDKNKGPKWINQFDGLGLESVTPEKWKVKKDGGRFDQRAGATISARAVTNASGRALAWAAANQERIFAAASASNLK